MPKTCFPTNIFPYFSWFAQAALLPALALALVLFPHFASAQDEPVWQVTRPVDKTVIPLDQGLTYEGHAPGEEQQQPQAKPGEQAGDKSAQQPGQQPAQQPDQKPATASKPEPAPKPKPTQAAKPAPKPAAVEPVPATGPKTLSAIGPVRAEVQADALILTVPCGHAPGDVGFLNLSGPKRLALDIQGAWDLQGDNALHPDDPRVKYVVLGEHPDFFRLVVHFADENAKDPVQPVIESKPDQVILRVPLP